MRLTHSPTDRATVYDGVPTPVGQTYGALITCADLNAVQNVAIARHGRFMANSTLRVNPSAVDLHELATAFGVIDRALTGMHNVRGLEAARAALTAGKLVLSRWHADQRRVMAWIEQGRDGSPPTIPDELPVTYRPLPRVDATTRATVVGDTLPTLSAEHDADVAAD